MKERQKEKPKKNSSSENEGQTNKPKFNHYWIYGLIFVVIIGLQFFNFGTAPDQTTQKDFFAMIRNHEVEKVLLVNEKEVRIFLTQDALNSPKYQEIKKKGFMTSQGPHFIFEISSVEDLYKRMEETQKDFMEKDIVFAESLTEHNYMENILGWLLPVVLIVVIWIIIFRRMSGGVGGGPGGQIFNIGKSRAKVFDKSSNIKVDFKDVAGLEEAKVEVKEIVDFLKNPKKYTELGGKIPKGALLIGPPGTGKTLLAKAVAGEANVPFFSISGSDFVEMFVGVGAARVRDLFKEAKSKAPCIVFIDEIDAVGRARGRNPNFGANDERENTLNQLLTEMDGFASNSGVIILAATNRADILDRALMRAGRFDRQIHVELPDLNERREIFNVHLKPIKIDQTLDVSFLAKQTPGFSGADIANVCNEAALIAARNDKKIVEKQDFLDAIDRIVGGLEKKNKIITPDEKKIVAWHEAGHATISWLLEYANPLVKVTIIPRGKALGAAWYLPEERQVSTVEQILDDMCATLGGRASEEITFGKISTGALNDLEKVTKQAYAMVSYYGMSDKIGNISFYDSSGQNDFAFNKPYSEKTAEVIDQEVNTIVENAYKRAKEVLLHHKEGLNNLAQQLLEKEVIFGEDLENIFGKRQFKTREEQKAEVAGKSILTDPVKNSNLA